MENYSLETKWVQELSDKHFQTAAQPLFWSTKKLSTDPPPPLPTLAWNRVQNLIVDSAGD